MFSIGLTGGIGSGKSAVADLLVDRGAWLVDADVIAREVVEPGGPAYEPLVDRFGTGILTAERTIDRQALADIAFSSEQALADLNAITHPAIGIEMIERQQALAETDALVVLAIPLLRAIHRETMVIDRVVVVDCPTEIAINRLVTYRSFPEADARARIAAQISREERRSDADFVVVNDAGLTELRQEVERLWDWIAAARVAG
jgi:dephospho-CoA kinase